MYVWLRRYVKNKGSGFPTCLSLTSLSCTRRGTEIHAPLERTGRAVLEIRVTLFCQTSLNQYPVWCITDICSLGRQKWECLSSCVPLVTQLFKGISGAKACGEHMRMIACCTWFKTSWQNKVNLVCELLRNVSESTWVPPRQVLPNASFSKNMQPHCSICVQLATCILWQRLYVIAFWHAQENYNSSSATHPSSSWKVLIYTDQNRLCPIYASKAYRHNWDEEWDDKNKDNNHSPCKQGPTSKRTTTEWLLMLNYSFSPCFGNLPLFVGGPYVWVFIIFLLNTINH